jgi:DNA-3-methyladenine glycosylase I
MPSEKVEKPKSYCEFVEPLEPSNVHKYYHDHNYGFPISSDNELFGRLILEINQAGLSWTTILNKQDNFREAFSNFDIKKIASYEDTEIDILLSNSGIIRNRLKIKSVIYNAQQIVTLQKEHGSFKAWLDKNHPLVLAEWVKLFKKTFKFTGGEITNEFLVSSGYLKGAHIPSCPFYKKSLSQKPMWSSKI